MIYQHHPINREWPALAKVDLFRQMTRIRRFETAALKRYGCGKMAGFLVLGTGQESVAAGLRSMTGPHDHSISGWRGMGHALAAGMEMGPCMTELYGKRNGCSKGKGGAFSFFEPARHHWGCHATAAAHTPLAAGLAFGLKLREIPGAVLCFLGDGAVNQGVYHESLNLAGLFDLPVIYIIENNGYAMGTSVSRSSAFTDCLARRAETYGIDWDLLGDTDPYEIRAKLWPALERARHQQRPSVIEINTYRYYGSHVADAMHQRYRSPEEIEQRKLRDSLMLWRHHLTEEGILDEIAAMAITDEANAEANAAVKFAEEGVAPEISEVTQDVYWESDHATPPGMKGRLFFNDG